MNDQNMEQIQLSFALDDCKKGSAYKIEFQLDKEIFETEKTKCDSNSTHIDFSKTFICNFDFRKIQLFILKLIRWKDKTHFVVQILGEAYKLSLSDLITSQNSTFTCLANDKLKNSEKITIRVENPNYFQQKENKRFTFFDYMKAGIKLKSIIGIDFTQGSEHGIDEKNNQYLQTIAEFREIMYCYMRDFDVYGYGAKFSDNNQKGDFFNLNLKDKSPLHGYTNVEKAYKECFKKINYCDKDSLSPLIRHLNNKIMENYEAEDYYIFLLLISNPPKKEDIQKCIDAFIENTFLPLSVIVIGIGDKDFKSIKSLFSNKHRFSSKDIEKSRNNIYFFPLKNFNFKYDLVLQECLKEIPKQLVEYYNINSTTPDDIRSKNVSNIRNSIKLLDSKRSCLNIDDGSAPPSFLEFSIKEEDPKKKESQNYNLIQSNNNENNAYQYDKFEKPTDDGFNKFETDKGNSEDNIYYNDINGNRMAQPNENEKNKNNYIPNPYSSNPYKINKINEFKDDEKYKENKINNEGPITPMGFKVEMEKIEDDKKNNYNSSINKINDNYDNDKYYNKIPKKEDDKYYNKINSNDDDDVKYYNKTPGQGDKNNNNQINDNNEDEKDKYFNIISEKEDKKYKNNKINENNEEKYYNIRTPEPGDKKFQFNQFQKQISNKNINPLQKQAVINNNNPYQKQFSNDNVNSFQKPSFNNKINNIINDNDERVYYNQTPGEKEDKKIVNSSNPYNKNNNLLKSNSKNEEDEKYVNTPGCKEAQNTTGKNNPFKSNNNINDNNNQNQDLEIRRTQTERINQNRNSLMGNQFKQSLELIKKRSSINASKESTKSSHNSYGLNMDDKNRLSDSNLPYRYDYGRDN